MKPSFLTFRDPYITAILQVCDPQSCIARIHTALYHGAQAFGLQLECLEKQYREEKVYRAIFDHMEDKPVYITNYRSGLNEGCTDEECVEGLLLARRAGGTLLDVMGDLYDRGAPMELTQNAKAIDRQKKLIDQIHQMGGEVLMSSHVFTFQPAEKVLEIALAQQARGADIAKIVTGSDTEEQMLENLKTTALLKKELKIPYLFLSGGNYCKIHRMVGPMLGSCMWLCADQYDFLATKSQPLLAATQQIVANFDYKPQGVDRS